MAKDDDTEEKKFPPSVQKLLRLRQESTVPHSKEFPAAMAALAVSAFLFLSIGSLIERILAMFEESFQSIDEPVPPYVSASLASLALRLENLVGPALCIALAVSVVTSFFDAGGFIFSFKPLSFDLNRLNPVEGIKKMFQLASLVELLKQAVKLVLIFVLSLLIIKVMLNSMFWAPTCGESCSVALTGYVMGALTVASLAVLIVAAVIDIKVSRVLFKHEHRMTISESKREAKDTFGDPHMRQARRRFASSPPRQVKP